MKFANGGSLEQIPPIRVISRHRPSHFGHNESFSRAQRCIVCTLYITSASGVCNASLSLLYCSRDALSSPGCRPARLPLCLSPHLRSMAPLRLSLGPLYNLLLHGGVDFLRRSMRPVPKRHCLLHGSHQLRHLRCQCLGGSTLTFANLMQAHQLRLRPTLDIFRPFWCLTSSIE